MQPGKSHLPFFLLAVLLLITGLFIFRDYGISWDEDVQRRDNGLVNYNYIHNGDYESLINGNEKYHGPAFEIGLIYLEKIFNLKSSRDFYLMRHLVNFLVYFISVVFFYFIIYCEFKNRRLALLGTLFLILTPRIFADAFYNSKDLVFMSFIIINIFTTLWFLRKYNVISAIVNGFVTGLVVDIRVMGIIVPAITSIMVLIAFVKNNVNRKHVAASSLAWLLSTLVFIYAFWPVLWRDPIHHFIKSITEMSHYHWDSYLTFLGEKFDAKYIPRIYIPVWMGMTIPVLFLILFFAGTIILTIRFFRRERLTDYDWLNLFIFFVPLASVIILNSVVYDGWRHLYFIYPSFLLLGLKGYEWIEGRLSKIRNGYIILKTGTYVYCGYLFCLMIWLHPYGNIYFNSFAGNSLDTIRKNFEIDYWGLSYKEALDHILETDTSSFIYYCPTENPGRDNVRFIDDKQKTRICITVPPELSDYYVTTYRYQHKAKSYAGDYNIERNGVIASVYDLRKDKIDLDSYTPVAVYSNSFETPNQFWSDGRDDKTRGYSGSVSAVFDTSVQFGCGMQIDFPQSESGDLHTTQGFRRYLSAELFVRSDEVVNSRYILQIDSTNNELIHYDAHAIEFYRPGEWVKISWRVFIPNEITSSNKIKMYIWNLNRNNFNVDDITVKLYSVPDSLYQNFKANHPIAYYKD